MNGPSRTRRNIFYAAAVSAIAIAAYRALTGRELWMWLFMYVPFVFPLLVPWIWKTVLEYGDSLPPKTPKAFDDRTMPFWWRYIDIYLAVAAIAWISLLLSTSIPSTPEPMIRGLWWIIGMGPLLVIGAASLVELLFRRVPDKPA